MENSLKHTHELHGNLTTSKVSLSRIIITEEATDSEFAEREMNIRTLRRIVEKNLKIALAEGIEISSIVLLQEPNWDYMSDFNNYLKLNWTDGWNVSIKEILEELEKLQKQFGEEGFYLTYNGNTRGREHISYGKKYISGYEIKSEELFSLIPEEETIGYESLGYLGNYFRLLTEFLLKTIRAKKIQTFQRFKRNNPTPFPETHSEA